MKKRFALFAVAVIIVSCNTQPTRAEGNVTIFADLKEHWAKTSVELAISKKYVDGYGDGTFRPENFVTAAEFIKMVVTASKIPVEGTTSGGEWYVPYVNAAVDKGLIREDGTDKNFLNAPLTRLEMAKLAVRATDPALQSKIVSINDQGAMYTATSKGLIQGLNNGELAQSGATTRAQSVTVIERILSANDGAKLEVDKKALSRAGLEFKRTNLFSMIPIFAGPQGRDYQWDPAKLTLETTDGLFKGSVDQVIAIDMADPQDPNRELLGDISQLHWFNFAEDGRVMPLVQDYPDSWIILMKSHTDFVKDTQAYAENGQIGFGIYGFEIADMKALQEGKLNTLAPVFRTKRGDTPAYILPKTGFNPPAHGIDLKISAPARPPVNNSSTTITTIQVVR